MMAKKILGVDIGYDRLKLVLANGSRIVKTVNVEMPEKLMRDGGIASVEAMGELLRNTMREAGIRCSRAAWVISNENAFVRSVIMPQMTADQLVYNLPFEFRDYITSELKDYVYDYAMISAPRELKEQQTSAEQSPDGEQAGPTMELLAAAVPASLLAEMKQIFRKAGLKMVNAAPVVCSYMALIRKTGETSDREYCILDLGYHGIRMYIYRGDRHVVTRVLETGLFQVDNAISDAYNVDVHLAHTYLMTNFDNCQNKDVCINVFNNIAVELMRAMNFYRFRNPESQLADIWLCGGGADIPALQTAIDNMLDLKIHQASELVPGGESLEECAALVQAIGITQY